MTSGPIGPLFPNLITAFPQSYPQRPPCIFVSRETFSIVIGCVLNHFLQSRIINHLPIIQSYPSSLFTAAAVCVPRETYKPFYPLLMLLFQCTKGSIFRKPFVPRETKIK